MTAIEPGSISQYLAQLQGATSEEHRKEVADELAGKVQEWFGFMYAYAAKFVGQQDAEAVVIEAFGDVLIRLLGGHYPQVTNREELSRLLRTFVHHGSCRHLRAQLPEKRKRQPLSQDVEHLPAPSAEEEVEVDEDSLFQQFLSTLGDDHDLIALAKTLREQGGRLGDEQYQRFQNEFDWSRATLYRRRNNLRDRFTLWMRQWQQVSQ